MSKISFTSSIELIEMAYTVAIVTPSFNSADYIDETILSVVAQRGNFAIRYHIQDGGSTDDTVNRLRQWKKLLVQPPAGVVGCRSIEFSYAVEKDDGMYDGINRAFARTGGDIMTWINSDDRMEPAALQTVCDLMTHFPECNWVTGRNSLIRHDGARSGDFPMRAYSRALIGAGLYDGEGLGYVQQEGTFWRTSLWAKCGGSMREDLRLAGDFELWTRMAQYSDLVAVNAFLASFRRHPTQKSSNMAAYRSEMRRVQETRPEFESLGRRFLAGEEFGGPAVQCAWPSGTWIWQDLSIQGPGLTANAWKSETLPSWILAGGAAPLEPANPEYGLDRPCRWFVGRQTTLSVDAKHAGEYRLVLTFRNFHIEQRVWIVSDTGKVSAKDLSVTDAGHWDTVVMDFVLPKGQSTIQLYFRCSGAKPPETRDLTILVRGLDLFPKSARLAS